MTAVGSRPIVPCNQAIGCSSTTPKVILVTTLLCVLLHTATGFVVSGSTADATRCSRCSSSPRVHRLRTNASKNSDGGEGSASSEDDEEEEDEYDYEYEREPALCSDVRGRPAGVVLEDLNWRIEKLRLEEANKRRFLKSGPRFLPYEECQKWVQAWGNRWESAEEWKDWIASGEKRNAYIPSRPDEYFKRTGDWISWEHFLGVPEKEQDDESDA